MKNSYFNCTSQRFSIRKYSFGAASVLLGVFLLSGVQTAHADEQTAVSESTASITSDNGVVSEKVTSSILRLLFLKLLFQFQRIVWNLLKHFQVL
ncbi:YSIRK-type signal peptide-containing protein [Streptococcus sp. VTCC 12813]|uniref:YSIRK-type signal peptide-containing protein n=1 Tax=Streptococcus raffinosi TaxID=3053355 RepID=A0ABT7LS75_9STRE|nr:MULTISPECIES: YSIRK-type signal peptide-containing protein [unclassified Streptococcus]MDL5043504.1 YSIRK-type signal peptide-containing protein [Streptococcus sp. VTCC 12812]MDM0094677.1 YSIRK-type signal peptide-containing protein [Streptococcus sp. VTCC 12813]